MNWADIDEDDDNLPTPSWMSHVASQPSVAPHSEPPAASTARSPVVEKTDPAPKPRSGRDTSDQRNTKRQQAPSTARAQASRQRKTANRQTEPAAAAHATEAQPKKAERRKLNAQPLAFRKALQELKKPTEPSKKAATVAPKPNERLDDAPPATANAPVSSTTRAATSTAAVLAAVSEPVVVGLCQTLEKPYLRLTGAADPNQIRPLPILQAWFKMLINKQQRLGAKRYDYTSDQLKAIRQDLVVQRIENDFTVSVYETHCLLALEFNDLQEFKVCSTRLTEICGVDMKSRFVALQTVFSLSFMEPDTELCLLASQISVCDQTPSDASNNQALPQSVCLLNFLRAKGANGCADSAAAAKLASAALSKNYHVFFIEFHKAPPMIQAAGKVLFDQTRIAALRTIVTSYRPCVRVAFLTSELGFGDDASTVAFLRHQLDGICFGRGTDVQPIEDDAANELILTKQSMQFARK